MKRILLAGVVGGVVIFVWSAFSHMVLPLGGMGLRELPNEDEVVATLRQSVPESGLYLFPGFDMRENSSPEQQQAWQAKYSAGPVGMLVYQRNGGEALSPRQLLTELASNVGAALLLAWVLSPIGGGYARRVLASAFLGLFAWLSISASYWNWYGFPGAFIAAEGIDQFIGWGLAGLAMAAIMKRRRANATSVLGQAVLG